MRLHLRRKLRNNLAGLGGLKRTIIDTISVYAKLLHLRLKLRWCLAGLGGLKRPNILVMPYPFP